MQNKQHIGIIHVTCLNTNKKMSVAGTTNPVLFKSIYDCLQNTFGNDVLKIQCGF